MIQIEKFYQDKGVFIGEWQKLDTRQQQELIDYLKHLIYDQHRDKYKQYDEILNGYSTVIKLAEEINITKIIKCFKQDIKYVK